MDAHSTTRFVARLSERCWGKVDKIFSLFEEGKVKGQRKPKHQLGLPDCKKSNWQFLHNLSEEQQYSLLEDLSTCSISFSQAADKAKAFKQEEQVKYDILITVVLKIFCDRFYKVWRRFITSPDRKYQPY